MRQLSSFIAINANGGDRISYTYDSIDEESGELVEPNIKGSFFVVDEDLRGHIEAIREYIRKNKLSE